MRKIIVVPYDDRWPEMFEAESLLIKTLLGGGMTPSPLTNLPCKYTHSINWLKRKR